MTAPMVHLEEYSSDDRIFECEMRLEMAELGGSCSAIFPPTLLIQAGHPERVRQGCCRTRKGREEPLRYDLRSVLRRKEPHGS